MFSLANKHVFLTGGSSGIGLEIARQFVEQGARVTVFDLQQSNELSDLKIRYIEGSVASENDVRNAVDESCEHEGALDVLINNAGIALAENVIEQVDIENFRAVLEVNLYGVLYGLKYGSRRMKDGGSIINTASLAATVTMPSYTGYSVSKSGIVKLTQQAALELGDRGIRVNAICPGTTVTPMEPADSDESKLCAKMTALGRTGTVKEQAAVYLFLAADESSYITGQAINVDGGWLHGVPSAVSKSLLD